VGRREKKPKILKPGAEFGWGKTPKPGAYFSTWAPLGKIFWELVFPGPHITWGKGFSTKGGGPRVLVCLVF